MSAIPPTEEQLLRDALQRFLDDTKSEGITAFIKVSNGVVFLRCGAGPGPAVVQLMTDLASMQEEPNEKSKN